VSLEVGDEKLRTEATEGVLDVLLVEDDGALRAAIGQGLRALGHRVTAAATEPQALALLETQTFDAVIADVNLQKGSGLSLFRHVNLTFPAIKVILMTGFGSVTDAVTALKEGAYDYVTKPFDIEVMSIRLDRISERRRLDAELAAALATPAQETKTRIIGRTPAMVRLSARIDTIAASDASVLITGESGTGKELVAHRLHELSARAEKPFVAVNCAAFPESLLEAELFGYEKGAFTGAAKKRDGRFKAADGGTLFLDEVAEMPVMAQVKLLRVLQDGALEPLGTNDAIQVDVRVITATHRNLKERIAQGLFREDLYYRLKVLDVAIPPLRERRGDLPVLVAHFLRSSIRPGAPVPVISPRAWMALSHYAFPGNVRELGHAIEHAVVLAQGGAIDLEHLPTEIVGHNAPSPRRDGALPTLAVAAKEFEREYLRRALTLSDGKKAIAAESLGISRKNLWEKLKSHEMPDAGAECE
jgi:DNA-binding NtrC family response regulator